MFKSLYSDLKYGFQKRNSTLTILLAINIIIFLLAGIAHFIFWISGFRPQFYDIVNYTLCLNPNLEILAKHPWTFFLTFFSHIDFFHILWNMLFLYMFGNILGDLIGSRRLLSTYVLGGIFANLMVIFCYNVFPSLVLVRDITFVIGASGAIYSVAMAAATISPRYEVNLMIFGPVKIMYIVGIYLFLSVVFLVNNTGGNLAHIGGALFGFTFAMQLRRGRDLGRFMFVFWSWLTGLFKPKPKLKVSYKKKKVTDPDYVPDQTEIDAILDKIGKSGYDSLTKDEKQKLFKASQR